MLTQRDKNILPNGRDHETAMRLLNEPGAVLQWRNPQLTNPPWWDWNTLSPGPFRDDLEWRIKPKTLRYRVALVGLAVKHTITAHDDDAAGRVERFTDFVRWLGDWQEVEV